MIGLGLGLVIGLVLGLGLALGSVTCVNNQAIGLPCPDAAGARNELRLRFGLGLELGLRLGLRLGLGLVGLGLELG